MGSTALLLASMWVGVVACDASAEAEAVPASVQAQGAADVVVAKEAKGEAAVEAGLAAEAGAEVTIEPASFDLAAVSTVVKEGEIESAAELEVIVNDEARGYNRIDIDADGKIDHVQVVEVEVEGEAKADVEADVVLELRVIPSSKIEVEHAVTFATVSFVRHPVNPEVEIRASYTAVVHQPEVHVYTHVVPVRIDAGVIVGGSVFLSWVYAVERPVYVGVYVVDDHGHWIPPGHVKHGHWKATGDLAAHGEVRGKAKVDGKASGHGHGKGSGGLSIQFGGSGKGSTKSSSKSHGGSDKGSKPSKSGGSSKSTGGSSKSTGGSGKGGSKGGKGKGK